MIKKLLLSLFLFTITNYLFAQIQSEKGKIILKDGTELKGTVTHFYDNAKEIILADSTGTKYTFTPDQIRRICLNNGKRFASGSFTKAGQQHEAEIIMETILLSPTINLYKQDEPTTTFYVEKDDKLYRLENNASIIEINGRSHKKYDHQYITVLNVLMGDQPDMVDELSKIKLNEDDLTSAILKYQKGEVTYYAKKAKASQKFKPYWAAIAAYSNYASYRLDETDEHSYGVQLGLQVYNYKGGRSSLRLPLEYAFYQFPYTYKAKAYTLSVKYLYDVVKRARFNAYLGVHLFDISYFDISKQEIPRGSILKPRPTGPSLPNNSLSFMTRFSPFLGFEAKASEHMGIFAEANHLLQIGQLPTNFSLGVKYTLSHQ